MLIGFVATRIFDLASWVTPGIAFNNTIALPLLLIQSLDATGILDVLLRSDSDTTANAINRAKSYFLVCAIIGNTLTFAVGPRLLGGEESPDEEEDVQKQHEERDENEGEDGVGDEEDGHGHHDNQQDNTSVHEQTSLLPDHVVRQGGKAAKKTYRKSKKHWDRLPSWAQRFLHFLYDFINAPLVGTMVGIVIGLVPALHKVFFANQQDGGIFKAWLTNSISNIGGLFATLNVLTVGVKLSSSLRKMKRGEDSGSVPWVSLLVVLVVRFVFWPVYVVVSPSAYQSVDNDSTANRSRISIGVIYLVASRTSWLPNDPILWFTLMLLPTGPPSIKLLALADVNGSSEGEKLSITKFLTVTYIISPLICFAVVGSLSACEVVMRVA